MAGYRNTLFVLIVILAIITFLASLPDIWNTVGSQYSDYSPPDITLKLLDSDFSNVTQNLWVIDEEVEQFGAEHNSSDENGELQYSIMNNVESIRTQPVISNPKFQLNAEHYFNIFTGLDFSSELEKKIHGSPLDPLPEFRNPCWNISLADPSPYPKDWVYTRKIDKLTEFYEEKLGRGESWRIRCMPHLLLIGFTKSGTSDINHRMNLHPEVFSHFANEIFFWSGRITKASCPGKDKVNISEYADIFDGAARGISEYKRLDSEGNTFHPGITMEATSSTAYLMFNWDCLPLNHDQPEPIIVVPHIVYSVNPAQRMLTTLRNPVDRLYSMYRMRSKSKKTVTHLCTPQQFDELTREAIPYWTECIKWNTERGCAYNNSLIPHQIEYMGITLRAGMYHVFIQDWLDVFPADQMYFVKFEEYNADIRGTLAGIFNFLELKKPNRREWDVIVGEDVKNVSPGSSSPMLASTRQILEEFYRPFNVKLQQLIGERFFW